MKGTTNYQEIEAELLDDIRCSRQFMRALSRAAARTSGWLRDEWLELMAFEQGYIKGKIDELVVVKRQRRVHEQGRIFGTTATRR